MLTKPNILFLLILLFTINVSAQKKDAAIKGTITMADGNAAYATVQLKRLKNITAARK